MLEKMRSKSCYFESISSCSNEPISIEVSPSPLCNDDVVTSFYLPEVYGEPNIYLTSCQHEPCSRAEKHGQTEFLSFEEKTPQLTKSLQFLKYTYFELFLYGDKCIQEICTLSFNSSIVSNCSEVATAKQPKNSGSMYLVDSSLKISVVFPAVSLALLLAIFALCIAWKRKTTRRNASDPMCGLEHRVSMHVVMEDSPIEERELQSVFIVFTDDHPLHKDVVLKFASFLQADFGFRIILDLYDREAIYKDPAAWLESSLTANKVLIIWSSGSEQWLNNKTTKYDMFTPTVKALKNDVLFERKSFKYVCAYFDYCSAESIQTVFKSSGIPSFKIEEELENLLHMLNDSEDGRDSDKTDDTKMVKESWSNYWTAFKNSLLNMREFVNENPKWYQYVQESTVKQCLEIDIHSKNIPSTSTTA